MITDVNADSKGIDHPKPPRRSAHRTILILLILFALAAVTGSIIGYFVTSDIPEVSRLENWPPVVSVLFAVDGTPTYQFGGEKRIWSTITRYPQFIQAIIATEDARFLPSLVDPMGLPGRSPDLIHLKMKEGAPDSAARQAPVSQTRQDAAPKIQEAVL
jgi:membrane peptidoglycan carboxypeptidase